MAETKIVVDRERAAKWLSAIDEANAHVLTKKAWSLSEYVTEARHVLNDIESYLVGVEHDRMRRTNALDPKNHVVLEMIGNDALVFCPGAYEPYVLAHEYNPASGEWQSGTYAQYVTDLADEINHAYALRTNAWMKKTVTPEFRPYAPQKPAQVKSDIAHANDVLSKDRPNSVSKDKSMSR